MNISITLTDTAKTALIQAIESTIDMLQDMAIDPMWLNPTQIREMAQLSDEEIRSRIKKNSEEAYRNVDQLVEMQLLYADIKSK